MNQGWSGSSMISGSRPSGDSAGRSARRPSRGARGIWCSPRSGGGGARRSACRRRSRRPGCPWPAPPHRRPSRMVPPRSPLSLRFSSSLPRIHSVIRPTTGSSLGPNSVEPALLDAGQIARRLDHRHLHAEADAEVGHACACARSGPRGSCPPSRARRSRRAPGCRARPPGTAPGPRARTPRSRSSRASPSRLLAMPPWNSASFSDL